MKNISLILFLLLAVVKLSFGQEVHRPLNKIEVTGYAKVAVSPDFYNLIFTLQEAEKKSNSAVYGKTSIDSITTELFNKLKLYQIDKRNLQLIKRTSSDSYQLPWPLYCYIYELKQVEKNIALKLVNEVRIQGLKGIVVKGVFDKPLNQLKDTLFSMALKDANEKAIALAARTNKKIGELIDFSISQYDDVYFGNPDFNNYETYSLNKFEINLKENKFAKCSIRVAYELK